MTEPLTGKVPHSVVLARQALSSLAAQSPSVQGVEASAALGVDWLKQQGLAWLAYHDWQFVDYLAPELKRELQLIYYLGVMHHDLQRDELASVLKALDERHIRAVAVKGAALAYHVYPEAVCRPMGDVDLWLQPDDMLRAASVLAEQGYVLRFKETRPVAMARQNGGELQLIGQAPGTGLIELHWGVFPGEWLQRTAKVDDAELWARTMPAQLAGQPALMLSPEDNVLQVAAHLALSHNMGSPWLRGLLDIALLTRRYPVDWRVIVQRARDWRIATVLWLVLSLTVDLAGLEAAAEAARQLQPSALRRRAVHRFVNAQTLVEMRDLSKSKWRYVYLLLMVDRLRDILKLMFRTLWPEREWLMARYGHYTFATRLRHLFNAARGRI